MKIAPWLLTLLAAAPAAAGTMSGIVRDANGVAMYPVDIDAYVSSSGLPVTVNGDSTLANGSYSFTLPSGTYDVVFRPAPGAHRFEKTFKSQNLAANIHRDVSLALGRYVSGRVVRASGGTGVSGVNVDFHSPADGSVPGDVQDDLSGADGSFNVLVTPGTWNVEFIALVGDRLAPLQVPSVNLAGDVALGDLALGAGHLVSGATLDQGFFPVADADLDVRGPSGAKIFTPNDNSDESGVWQLVVPPGTWNVTCTPPAGLPLGPVTARDVVITQDRPGLDFLLPPAVQLRVRSLTPSLLPLAGVDADLDSLPLHARLEAAGDVSASNGRVQMMVPLWKYRLRLIPPVATRLLPVQWDSVQVNGALDLGDVVHAQGHWVQGTVVETGNGAPVAGANLDFVRVSNGQLAITPGDVTAADGTFRVVTDDGLYELRVHPPGAAYQPLTLPAFRSLADTTVSLALAPANVGVEAAAPGTAYRSRLSAPWPNPARGGAWLAVETADPRARLEVRDLAGRKWEELHHGPTSGTKQVRWSGRDAEGRPLPPGLYFVTLEADGARFTRRIALVH